MFLYVSNRIISSIVLANCNEQFQNAFYKHIMQKKLLRKQPQIILYAITTLKFKLRAPI